jgi:3,4-dihydroxy 2-butanone 4-phosphate synthase/GTP cyclohydrolase II
MRLADWLSRNGVSRVAFARRIGVTPGAVTQLCNYDQAWLSRDTAELIARETRGAVTPNDFLPESAKEALMPHSVTEAVEAFARGEIVIVTDDDDRENEGDLIVAASLCTPEKMAFIIRHTSGIVCAPVAADDARRLHLDPMVAANDAPLGTAFTVSVDYRHGLTTGISAEERTNTVRGLANGNNGAADFVPRPCLSAGRQAGRSADALRPYRGLCRPLPAGGPAHGGRALRIDERRRHGDARAAACRLCRAAQAQERHHR